MNSVNLQNIKSIYKNLLCDLHFNNKLWQREIEEKIPITTALCIKKNKILSYTFNQKSGRIENHKELMKETEDKNKWKNIPSSWIARVNVVKMITLPNAVYRFYAISIKITMAFITESKFFNLYGITNYSK